MNDTDTFDPPSFLARWGYFLLGACLGGAATALVLFASIMRG